MGIIATFRSVTRNDDRLVALPRHIQMIPLVGYVIETLALTKINVQTSKIAKDVEGASPEIKASARGVVISKLQLRNQILEEGNKRSYLTIALCVGCLFLGILPIFAAGIAIVCTFFALVSRGGHPLTNQKIEALSRFNNEDKEFLRQARLGGLI